MNKKVAVISSCIVICAIAVLLLGCPPSVVRVDHPNLELKFMDIRPIQMLFGDRVIGIIGMGIGCGFRAIG